MSPVGITSIITSKCIHQDNSLKMTDGKVLVRKSNFELLRLLAMFLIVLYHIFIGTYEVNPDFASKSLWIPLHLGVPVFILISGYFHIKFSWVKFLKLVTVLFVYTIGIQAIGILLGGAKNYSLIFFISRSPYWFMTVYLMLFLLSPFINEVAERLTVKKELFFIVVLAIISIYLGCIHNFEAYSTGKNLLNFILIYTIGDLFHKQQSRFDKFPNWLFLIVFILLNTLEVFFYDFFSVPQLKGVIWKLSFPYNSPLLIINAFLLFVIFSRINIISKGINWAAGSCLGIYMLHHHPVVDSKLSSLSNYLIANYSQLNTVLLFVVMALSICAICIMVDKIVEYPIGKLFNVMRTNTRNQL